MLLYDYGDPNLRLTKWFKLALSSLLEFSPHYLSSLLFGLRILTPYFATTEDCENISKVKQWLPIVQRLCKRYNTTNNVCKKVHKTQPGKLMLYQLECWPTINTLWSIFIHKKKLGLNVKKSQNIFTGLQIHV